MSISQGNGFVSLMIKAVHSTAVKLKVKKKTIFFVLLLFHFRGSVQLQ